MRIHFESTTEQFEIIIQKAFQYGAGDLPLDNSLSWITIEQHDTAGTESSGTIESADTIEIASGVNDVFAFQHVGASLQISKTYSTVFKRPADIHHERNGNDNERTDRDVGRSPAGDHNDHRLR